MAATSPALHWLRDVTGATTMREIGQRLGKSPATIHRWAHNGIPPRTVLQLVAEYDYDLMDALETLEWLSPEERAKIAPTIDQLPTSALTAELHHLSGVVHERVTQQTGNERAER